MARCPAHDDRAASLSIREAGGKVLIRCFTGCETLAVVTACGLKMRDLFSGPPPSPEQVERIAAEREQRERQKQKQRVAERAVFDRIRKLDAIADELVTRLVRIPDHDSSGNAIARLFHQTLDQLRRAEAEVER
jgi:ribosomal protein S10